MGLVRIVLVIIGGRVSVLPTGLIPSGGVLTLWSRTLVSALKEVWTVQSARPTTFILGATNLCVARVVSKTLATPRRDMRDVRAALHVDAREQAFV